MVFALLMKHFRLTLDESHPVELDQRIILVAKHDIKLRLEFIES